MSRWRIDIPHRGRDQPVIDALCDTNTIADPEARVTAREILGQAAENGVQTVGQVLDHLEQMTQPQRRELHNRARVQNGLPTVEDVLCEHEAIATAFAEALAVSSKPDQLAYHGKRLADLSLAELKAYGDELTKDIETRPIRIVSFEC
jgi:hypothetical protein